MIFRYRYAVRGAHIWLRLFIVRASPIGVPIGTPVLVGTLTMSKEEFDYMHGLCINTDALRWRAGSQAMFEFVNDDVT